MNNSSNLNFGRNLQAIRKAKNLSQEELAEKMEVSRQAISKWESGGAYPEMEKLVELAEVLECSTDDLLRGEVKPTKVADKTLKATYDKLMNSISIWLSVAIGLVILGAASLMAVQDFGAPYDGYGLVILLMFVTVSVPIFVVSGIRMGNFKEKHPRLEQFYTESEIDKFNAKFMVLIATALVTIMAGLVMFLGAEASQVFPAESSRPVAMFLVFIAVGAPMFVFAGIRKDKFDIAKYNHENLTATHKESELVGRISGVIMILATMMFMIMGFVWEIWDIAWIVFPLGGMLCGIVAVILKKEDK